MYTETEKVGLWSVKWLFKEWFDILKGAVLKVQGM